MPLLPGDQTAVTHWKDIAHNAEFSFLKIWLETGRTHQIRAHFAHRGTPLLGDDYYGAPAREEPGHFLHCGTVNFTHPVTEELLSIEAPLPPHMGALVDEIVNYL